MEKKKCFSFACFVNFWLSRISSSTVPLQISTLCCSFSHWLYSMLLRISKTVLVFSGALVATGTTTTNYFVPMWHFQYASALRIALSLLTLAPSFQRNVNFLINSVCCFSILCLHFKSICIFSFCCAQDSDERIAVDICLFAADWWCACATRAFWHVVFELSDSIFNSDAMAIWGILTIAAFSRCANKTNIRDCFITALNIIENDKKIKKICRLRLLEPNLFR